jgi:hypothetical protein
MKRLLFIVFLLFAGLCLSASVCAQEERENLRAGTNAASSENKSSREYRKADAPEVSNAEQQPGEKKLRGDWWEESIHDY